MSTYLTELLQLIPTASGERDQQIFMAMAVLLSSLQFGPDPDCIAVHIKCRREFVAAMADRMEEANLWKNGSVDDQEWWDSNGELNGQALFAHAHVALGLLRREATPTGARYVDAATGELAGEWMRPVN